MADTQTEETHGEDQGSADFRLSTLLAEIAEGPEEDRISIGDLLAALKRRALGALIFIFAVPVALPLPPGVSTVFGAPLLFLTAQLMLGMQPWLPKLITNRSLKRSEAFRDAGTLYLLTWEDLGTRLSLRLETASGAPVSGNSVVAGDTGLASVFSTAEGPEPVVARVLGGPARAVAWHLAIVTFDGKEFRVSERTGEAPVVLAPAPVRVVRGRNRTR